MFDLNGNVIGINSQILSPTGGNVGIGFAIPAEEAKPVIDQLMKGSAIKRGYLGVGMQDVTDDIADALGVPKGRGTLVSRVEPDSAAAKAGIQAGDVIVKVGDRDVTADQTLSYLVANQAPGARVPLTIVRDNKTINLTVVMGVRPSEEQLAQNAFDPDDNSATPNDGPDAMAAASLGVRVLPLTPQIAQDLRLAPGTKGVVVDTVDPSSDAAGKGVRRGDVIVSVNRTPVATGADIAKIVTASKGSGKGTVLLYVQTRNIGRFVPIDIG